MKIKRKPTRLKGKKLHDLYKKAWERDKGICQRCGKWVPPGTPPHHIIFRSQGGEDKLENLVTLCLECHQMIHGGKKWNG